jgi:CMP-N-acetylneuraminic acid synthetase
MKLFTYIKHDSSRIARKNFQKLGGLPLWKHLIYEANKIFDVFIDTDSQDVIDECNRDINLKGVKAYFRDQKFIDMECDPNNSLSPALLMTENFLKQHVHDVNEIIILTHVTSPFLSNDTLLDAISKLKGKYETVHSVTAVQDFAWLSSFNNPINFNPAVVQRTQDLEKVYFSNGAFFIFKKSTFLKYDNRLGEHNYLYELNHTEGLEIDTPDDLQFAKVLYKGINHE